jgi:hypothetical protein
MDLKLTREHTSEVWGKVQGDTASDLIRRAATKLAYGESKDDIRTMCLEAGQNEEQAMLTYMAAKLLRSET